MIKQYSATACSPRCGDRGESSTADVAAAVGTLRAMQKESHPPFRIALHYGKVVVGVATMGEDSLSRTGGQFRLPHGKLAAASSAPSPSDSPANDLLAPMLPAPPPAPAHGLSGFDGDFEVEILSRCPSSPLAPTE
ncbi:MAG: hypothetical protein QM760_17895 [Nibricoccus sp.]